MLVPQRHGKIIDDSSATLPQSQVFLFMLIVIFFSRRNRKDVCKHLLRSKHTPTVFSFKVRKDHIASIEIDYYLMAATFPSLLKRDWSLFLSSTETVKIVKCNWLGTVVEIRVIASSIMKRLREALAGSSSFILCLNFLRLILLNP